MSRERYAYAVSHSSPRSLVQRGFVVLLVVTAVTLLVLAKSHHPAASRMRSNFLELLNPVLSAVSQPVTATRAMFTSVADYQRTVDDNRKLRAENDRLRHWQAVAMALKAENEALRKLMGYRPADNVSYVTARIIGQSPGAYSNTFMINVGSEQGLKMLQPVVDSYGLVGRIVDLSPGSARVLVLSDITSRVPVITGITRQRAILSGTGDSDLLRLSFLTVEQDNIQLGEQVVTTEEGGLIPGGIIIGSVFRKDDTGYMIKPVRPLTQSEYVRVMVLN
jgi:rod shape-determining protein MreC